jgi:hypothetical protein
MVISMKNIVRSSTYCWNNKEKCFYNRYTDKECTPKECFYAYIGYIPSEYKTTYPTKCMRGDRCAYDDDGYCMFESECEFAKVVPEYYIEEKRIWKEFE